MKRQNKYHFFFGGFRNSLYLCNVVWLRLYDFAECLKKRYFTNYNIKVMKKLLLMKTMLLLCALIVGSSSVWATYKLTKVTSVSAGEKYVFVSNDCALSNTVSSSALQTTDTYSATGLAGTEAYVWTLETATGGFYLKNVSLNSNSYLNNASKTNMSFGSKSSIWSIAFTDGIALISNTSNGNRFLGDAGGGARNDTYKAYATSNLDSYAHDFTVYVLEEEAAAAVATPTFSPDGGIFVASQSVTLSCSTDGATIYYTLDGTTPTSSSDVYSAAINLSSTTTIKAIAKKNDDFSDVATATYTIIEHGGTEADPYTVPDARAAIEMGMGITGVMATGIVSEIVTPFNSDYGNISFNISVDGLTTSDQLQAYRCKSFDGNDFTSADDVQVGDVVVIAGSLKKYNSIYEFEEGCQLISLNRPAIPAITVDQSSLTGFTYAIGNGPSDAQTFSVEGSNLTANITLTLGVSSNYEMSLAENSGYTNELSLTPTAGTVAGTTIYVRLKEGLAVNASYEGTITLTSTDATEKTVNLAGSVTAPNFTWDLSKASYSAASEDQVTWTSIYATMVVDKASSTTNANNYLPTAQSSSRFYKNSELTITPATGCSINSIEFTATTAGYANALKGSTWTNATAAASDKTVTVTPTDGTSAISATIGGTCGFTAVKIYYGLSSVPVTISAAGLATFASEVALDFTDVENLEAYIAKENGTKIELTQVNKVPAETGVLLRALNNATDFVVPVTTAATDNVDGNLFVRGTGADVATGEGPYNYVLGKHGGVVGFYKAGGMVVATNKAYLQTTIAAARIDVNFDETTALTLVNSEKRTVNSDVFDLQGRKVANPTKGLYIVNGKKVVVK